MEIGHDEIQALPVNIKFEWETLAHQTFTLMYTSRISMQGKPDHPIGPKQIFYIVQSLALEPIYSTSLYLMPQNLIKRIKTSSNVSYEAAAVNGHDSFLLKSIG